MGGPYDTSTYALMQAATAVLDQRQSFTEAELIEYLADCYPEVPEELRRPLVLGAVAGAQRAAHMYVIVEKNKASPDEQKRGMAANSACALSFWNMGLRTPSRAPSSSRRSSVSISENQPTVLTVNLAELQLPVSMEQSRSDLEQVQSTVLCQGATYEIVAAAPPDAPLVVPIDALAASSSTTTTLVEPYVPPMLPGSSYADMPYVPSATAAQTSQARTDPDSDPEPELSIVAPPDPALFDLQSEMEARKEEEIQAKEEEAQKKREATKKNKEEAEPKKTEEEPKKKKKKPNRGNGERRNVTFQPSGRPVTCPLRQLYVVALLRAVRRPSSRRAMSRHLVPYPAGNGANSATIVGALLHPAILSRSTRSDQLTTELLHVTD